MRELRWYLERFLDYPFHPETIHAEHVLDALKSWGSHAFNALFDRGNAREWFSQSRILQIRSDNPQILSWPWEALFDPQAGTYLAHRYRIERRLNQLADPPQLGELPTDRVNILMVVARPYKNDVGYRSIARPLVELIHSKYLPAHVDILRPPTFNQLREHLRAHPHFYHVIHFDGHGAYGNGSGQYSPHQFQGSKGALVFENERGEEDLKSASDLNALLHEHAVPAVVLNACQSATLDEKAEDAFATVATALLRGGMRSVVAMAYSLYVSGAKVFLPAFYGRLFETGSIAAAALAGRQQMLADKKRISARGPFPLEDWLLPVLYQQAPLDLGYAKHKEFEAFESRLPEEVQKQRDPYGFIGRDGPILEMERALQRQTPCILIQGLGGAGKTTLARGFLRWLDETGGLDGALWFDFRDIRSAAHVINRIGEAFYDANFGIAPNKLERIAVVLEKVRVLMVWDNFESAAQNLPAADRDELGRLLDAIRSTRGKVIMTSRSPEEWLTPPQRIVVRLGGLDREERWEYCERILAELGLVSKVKRDDPALSDLMNQLAGHPLAMRAVLPRLERMSVDQIAKALKNNLSELGLNENEEQGRLFATLRFVELGLAPELQPLLALVGLHESYLDADYMEAMAERVDPNWTRARINQLMAVLQTAGLVRDIGEATCEMHPLLTSYLRSHRAAPETCERAFVDVMADLADALAPRELHEQRVHFLLHGANFRHALDLSAKLQMNQYVAALTQSLAAFAQNTRAFVEAARLFQQLAQHVAAMGSFKLEAAAYHQLGRIAEEQRDFAEARKWYVKSLAISERHGVEEHAAATYGQLGRIAQEQRDLATAREWYMKSLAISERQGNERGLAITYHQLGRIAEDERDFVPAQGWYLKSLTIEEKRGNERGAAITYQQLGTIALEQGDSAKAREWYLKSLAIKERHGNEHGAAITYYQLGRIAEKDEDLAKAREWYLKSVAIDERQGNEHGAAISYGQLGILAGLQSDLETAGGWLIRAIRSFIKTADQHFAEASISNFLWFYRQASPEDKQKLRTMWEEAGLGPFPPESNEAAET